MEVLPVPLVLRKFFEIKEISPDWSMPEWNLNLGVGFWGWDLS